MEFERHTGECWGTDPGEVHRGTGGGHGEGPRATSVKVFGTDKAQLEEPRVGLGGGLLSQGADCLLGQAPCGFTVLLQ